MSFSYRQKSPKYCDITDFDLVVENIIVPLNCRINVKTIPYLTLYDQFNEQYLFDIVIPYCRLQYIIELLPFQK